MSVNKVVGSPEVVSESSASREAASRQVSVGSQNLSLNGTEVLSGAAAGFGGGFAMGLVAVIVSLSHGFGLWAPFNDVAGALFPGIISTTSAINAETVLVGILIHFTISVLLGMLFTTIYSGLLKLTFDFALPLTVGLAYGWLIWMMVRFIFLPLLASGVYTVPAFIIAHGVYGVVLGLLYPLVRSRLYARRAA